MQEKFKNFGTATVKVELLNGLPYINTNPIRMSFDVQAHMFKTYENSPYLSPLLTEWAIDKADMAETFEGESTFAAVFPAKRIKYVDNYLKGGDAEQNSGSEFENFEEEGIKKPYISWSPVNSLPSKSAFLEFKNSFLPSIYDPQQALATSNNGTPITYNGPIWNDVPSEYVPPTNDIQTIKNYYEFLTGKKQDEEVTETSSTILPSLNKIAQMKVLDGLWWGIESDPFITDQMPFWVVINKQDAPTTSDHETIFIISIGSDDSENRYDLFLSTDNAPRLIDYTEINDEIKWVDKKWKSELARIIRNENQIEIGIMSVAGRLMIFVNKIALVYARVDRNAGDSAGKISECKISAGKVRVYGTNVQATIFAAPMAFAPIGAFALPIPSKVQFTNGGEDIQQWKGTDANNEPYLSVAELPTPKHLKQIYGVDCKKFFGDGGVCNPEGIGFHKKGTITFLTAADHGFNLLKDTDFYILTMSSEDGAMRSSSGEEVVIKYGGCPYFFRLKGILTAKPEANISPIDISGYVETVSENVNTSDYYQVKRTATVTCYNEGNVLNQFINGQKGIRIYWGWNGTNKLTFTGIVTGYNLSQRAGKEVVTLNCQDYSFILSNSAVLNSPFYDGMLATRAIIDLAKRAGCINPVIDQEDFYFLDVGANYNAPKYHFKDDESIDSCMSGMAKGYSCVYHFDENGVFHVSRLPGGLLSNFTSSKLNFSQSPDTDEKHLVILDEKNTEVNYASTVNVIHGMTVDRNTLNAIVYSTSSPVNNILFRRVYLRRQGGFGDLETLRASTRELASRMFYPIIKISFKTVGLSDTQLQIFDFITVDGFPLRILSIKRDFNAENNDFSQNYEAEWLGGNQNKPKA